MTDPIEQLNAWLTQAVDRQAQQVCLVPDEPVIYRVAGAIQREAGEVNTPRQLQRLAEAIFGKARCRRLGRKVGVLDARLRLPDGSFASVTATRAGGDISILARPVRIVSNTCSQVGVPEPIVLAAESRSGLLIVTGPAGCGKTTTCYALLEHLNATRPMHIVTIGYHADYVLEPKQALIQELQVGVDVPDMMAGVHAALLSNVNVVFVAEIRDAETLQACLRAAEADCLVITQLHQPTPPEAIDLIVALHPREDRRTVCRRLAQVLRGVLAQCLLPTPSGRKLAAYGAFVPTPDARGRIRQGADITPDDCSPTLQADIQRLKAEGKVIAAAADQALESLSDHRLPGDA